jgi:hypothetical protein
MTNTPRRRKIVVDVLEKMVKYLRTPNQEFTWSYEFLSEVLGMGNWRSRTYPWLKDTLLITVRGHSIGQATRYIVNQRAFINMWKLAHDQEFIYGRERARQWMPEVGKYISGEEEMPLDQKRPGGRLYAICQQIDRHTRSWLLPGRYDYDMRSAVVTLVVQYGINERHDFPKWSMYLGNIDAYRKNLSEKYGISLANAKLVFQLLFYQATFNGSKAGIGEVVGPSKCKAMMEDELLIGLFEEAGRAWENLGVVERRGRSRFDFYEQIEQQVMSEIYAVLDQNGIRYWPFHDGFTLLQEGQQMGDMQKLTDFLRQKTGYVVMFSEKVLKPIGT